MELPQSATTPSDESLMGRFQQRLDEAAIDELVSRYLRRGVAVARQILWDRSLADDAAQEAFVRLIRSRDSYDPAKPFSVWFFTILRNVCLGMIRRQRLEVETMQAMASQSISATELPTDPADTERLLATLPRIEREALTLRVAHDLSFADIGAALGISEAAAKKRAQRAIGRLRDRMNKGGSNDPILDPSAAAV